MPLWVERYLLPICAAIVFGLVILNPFKFDWPQRIALLVAISAFAYFLAHTVHKPKGVEAADSRVTALERQVKDLETRQQQAESEAASLKQKQTEIRNHLIGLITKGVQIRDEWDKTIGTGQTEQQQASHVDAVKKWHSEILTYLKTIPRSEIYLARFRAGTRTSNTYPVAIFSSQAGAWNMLMTDLEKLNEFLTDPDLGKP